VFSEPAHELAFFPHAEGGTFLMTGFYTLAG